MPEQKTPTADELDAAATILRARAAVIRIEAELKPLLVAGVAETVLAEILARDAEAACEAPDAEAARLRAELAEVSGRALSAAGSLESDDLSARLDARIAVAACAEEAEHLTGLLRKAQAGADSARLAASVARREAKRAAGSAAQVAAAIENPLTSDLGTATEAYRDWLVNSGMWLSDPRSEIARALITDLLGPSGVGREIQEEAIRAYLDGHPAALSAGGTDTLPSGSTVTHAPGRPSLVSRPRLSPAQAEAAMRPIPALPGDAYARAHAAGWDVP